MQAVLCSAIPSTAFVLTLNKFKPHKENQEEFTYYDFHFDT